MSNYENNTRTERVSISEYDSSQNPFGYENTEGNRSVAPTWFQNRPSAILHIPPIPESPPAEQAPEYDLRPVEPLEVKKRKYFEGPKPRFPTVSRFSTKFLGFDECSNLYLKFEDDRNQRNYRDNQISIGLFYSDPHRDVTLPFEEVETGLIVIASPEKKYFVRGQVLSKNKTEGTVTVFNVDEANVITVTKADVYEMSAVFMHWPFQAVKCELHELGVFTGSAVIYDRIQFIKKCSSSSRFRVTLIDKQAPYPSVVLCFLDDEDGPSLNTLVEEAINSWEIKIPPKRIQLQNVIISHANEKGFVWMHLENSLTSFVLKINTSVNDDVVQPMKEKAKNLLMEGEIIFFAMYDDRYHRIRVITTSRDLTTVIAEFIDFGNVETIDVGDLLPCDYFCEPGRILRNIPPQCVKAHLNGIDSIDVDEFYEYVKVEYLVQFVRASASMDDYALKVPEIELFSTANKPNSSLLHLNTLLISKGIARNKALFTPSPEQVVMAIPSTTCKIPTAELTSPLRDRVDISSVHAKDLKCSCLFVPTTSPPVGIKISATASKSQSHLAVEETATTSTSSLRATASNLRGIAKTLEDSCRFLSQSAPVIERNIPAAPFESPPVKALLETAASAVQLKDVSDKTNSTEAEACKANILDSVRMNAPESADTSALLIDVPICNFHSAMNKTSNLTLTSIYGNRRALRDIAEITSMALPENIEPKIFRPIIPVSSRMAAVFGNFEPTPKPAMDNKAHTVEFSDWLP